MISQPSFFDMQRNISSFSVSMAVSVAAELGIADRLARGARSLSSLSEECKCNEEFLRRLLLFLAGHGIFESRNNDYFAQSEQSAWLQSDIPGSLRYRAVFVGSTMSWSAWGALGTSLRTGQSAFKEAFGEGIFDYVRSHPVEAAPFNNFMTQQTRTSVAALVETYPFDTIGELVDVGGGHGALLAGLLKVNPAMRGVVFDLPPIVAGAGPRLEDAGLAGRFRLVGGSFFDDVPAGGDAYLLKFILHDWNDDDCLRILQNCRKAMPSSSRLLVIEHIIPETSSGPHFSRFMDIQMLVLTTGGRERNRIEFEKLLGAAGLELRRSLPTAIGLDIMECFPL